MGRCPPTDIFDQPVTSFKKFGELMEKNSELVEKDMILLPSCLSIILLVNFLSETFN